VGTPFNYLLPTGFAGDCVFGSAFGSGGYLVEAFYTSSSKLRQVKNLVQFLFFKLEEEGKLTCYFYFYNFMQKQPILVQRRV
jgi:hypothetical protein